MAHYVVAKAAASVKHEAMCTVDLKECKLLGVTPHAEICILAVVISGVLAIGALGYGHHLRKSAPNWITYSLVTLSILALFFAALLYVVASIGVLNEHAGWATWMTLAAALAASLFLSLERAAR